MFGSVTVVAGALVLAWPGVTALIIAVIVALELLVAGVFRLAAALADEEAGGGGRVLLAMFGVLSVLVGILLLRHPFQTLAFLILLLGIFWVVGGLLEAIHAIGAPDLPHRGWALAAGVLSLVAGIVVLSYPAATLFVMVWLFGLQLVLYGGITLARGLWSRHAERPAAPPDPSTHLGATSA